MPKLPRQPLPPSWASTPHRVLLSWRVRERLPQMILFGIVLSLSVVLWATWDSPFGTKVSIGFLAAVVSVTAVCLVALIPVELASLIHREYGQARWSEGFFWDIPQATDALRSCPHARDYFRQLLAIDEQGLARARHVRLLARHKWPGVVAGTRNRQDFMDIKAPGEFEQMEALRRMVATLPRRGGDKYASQAQAQGSSQSGRP